MHVLPWLHSALMHVFSTKEVTTMSAYIMGCRHKAYSLSSICIYKNFQLMLIMPYYRMQLVYIYIHAAVQHSNSDLLLQWMILDVVCSIMIMQS